MLQIEKYDSVFRKLDKSSWKKKLPEIFSSIVITRTAEIKNKFSRNNIVIDGVSIGEMRFIVGNP